MSIDKFLEELKVNSIADKTIRYYGFILQDADKYKPLEDKWKKEDVNGYVLSLKGKNKQSSIEIKKAILKKYFIWLGKEDIVEHLQINIVKNALKREDILTSEDINKMIEATESVMYKALIVFLYESGGRINEILQVRVKDTKETDEGLIISIPQTKTGEDYRRNIYPASSQYIRNLIAYTGIKGEDRLFQVKDGQANVMLKKIGKKAGIDKPITCHKLRHAQATDMVVRGYQESIIRKKLGWTNDSKMIARYTHLVDEDVIDATLEKNGQEVRKHPITNVNQAEPLNIVDAGMQLSKLSEENEALKEKMEYIKSTLTEENEWLKSNMINMREELRDLKEGLKARNGVKT